MLHSKLAQQSSLHFAKLNKMRRAKSTDARVRVGGRRGQGATRKADSLPHHEPCSGIGEEWGLVTDTDRTYHLILGCLRRPSELDFDLRPGNLGSVGGLVTPRRDVAVGARR